MRDDGALDDDVVVELGEGAVVLDLLPNLGLELGFDATVELGPLGGASIEENAGLGLGRGDVAGEGIVDFQGEEGHGDSGNDEGGAGEFGLAGVAFEEEDAGDEDEGERGENVLRHGEDAEADGGSEEPGRGIPLQGEPPGAERGSGEDKEDRFVANEVAELERQAVGGEANAAEEKRPHGYPAPPDPRGDDGGENGEAAEGVLQPDDAVHAAKELEGDGDEERVNGGRGGHRRSSCRYRASGRRRRSRNRRRATRGRREAIAKGRCGCR